MKANSRVLVALVVIVVLGAAFYKLGVSPKREEASKLDERVEKLQAAVTAQRQAAAAASAAKKTFPEDYHQLVLLGKAVPADDDTASLLVEVTDVAGEAKIDFRDVELDSTGLASAPTPVAAPPSSGQPSVTDVPSESSAAPAVMPATEAAAAVLPLGATVGTAGLGVMPYKLNFAGDFFAIADFMAGLDELVETKNNRVTVDGRLMTIDGFALKPHGRHGFPHLEMSMTVTTYLTPPSQGVTAGATPAAPAAAGSTATPTAATTGTTP
jgi:Tfp pilus assembly protein PilO